MKRAILGLMALALAAGPTAAAAQTAVGVRGGVRWAELESSQGAGAIESLTLAGYFGFGLSSNLAVQLEVIYGSRGSEALRVAIDELDAGAPPSEIEMSYLEVPLLLRAGFPGQRFLPSFFLGPYVGFLLDCEIQPSGQEGRACDTEGAPQRFSPRATDFGAVIGGGLDMAMGTRTIFLDARYSLGFLSIETGPEGLDARHRAGTVTAGFAIPLGR